MSENTVDDATPESAQVPPEGEKTFTQAQLDKIISNRLPEYENLKTKAAQFDSLTQSTEQSLEQARAQAAAAETELAWRDVLLLRQEVAASKGLDPKLWSRIQGENKDEIEADVNELVNLSPGRRPAGSFVSGASGGKQLTDKERAAQSMRGLIQR